MLVGAARVARALSLDVAAGGAGGLALASAATGAAPPWPVWLLLPSAIWVVYTADHLADARRAGHRAAAFRHRFHAQNARLLGLVAAVVAAAGSVAAVALLPGALVVAGTLVAAGAAMHLAIAQRPTLAARFPKEVSAAAVYTAGVWCAPVLSAPARGPWTGPAIALFFVAALANLLLNGLIEADQDARDGSPSWARTFGARATESGIDLLAAGAAVTGVAAAAFVRLDLHGVFLVLAALGALPALLRRLRPHVEPFERYRALGDLAFVLAAIPVVLR